MWKRWGRPSASPLTPARALLTTRLRLLHPGTLKWLLWNPISPRLVESHPQPCPVACSKSEGALWWRSSILHLHGEAGIFIVVSLFPFRTREEKGAYSRTDQMDNCLLFTRTFKMLFPRAQADWDKCEKFQKVMWKFPEAAMEEESAWG